MSQTSQAARRLKILRERSGHSMRAVAEALGWTLTRYQHYEDRYRRNYLPLELARSLADIFAIRGVPAAEVMALAGLETPAPETPPAAAPGPFLPRPIDAPIMPPRDLPVMGAVKGGTEGFYFNEGEAKEIVVRPPKQLNLQ